MQNAKQSPFFSSHEAVSVAADFTTYRQRAGRERARVVAELVQGLKTALFNASGRTTSRS